MKLAKLGWKRDDKMCWVMKLGSKTRYLLIDVDDVEEEDDDEELKAKELAKWMHSPQLCKREMALLISSVSNPGMDFWM